MSRYLIICTTSEHSRDLLPGRSARPPPPQVSVIGRTSSFQFKGRNVDLRGIGAALDAEYIVEGSVRKSGERLRIAAQLIRTADDTHVWSQAFDQPQLYYRIIATS
jgi:TolB-like protein